LWDSAFTADEPFYFGDQEEMGLGIRVATPMAVESGGTILDAEGRKDGRAVWGNVSDWCDYRGTIEGRSAGLTIFCHPGNFRPRKLVLRPSSGRLMDRHCDRADFPGSKCSDRR
jgi:hypothetical protein